MRRFVVVITVFCTVFCLSACGTGYTTENNSSITSTSNLSSDSSSSLGDDIAVLIGEVIDINQDEAKNPIGVSGNLFYYKSTVDNKNDTGNHTILKYDLTTQEKTIIGVIDNCTTASVTNAFLVGDKIFKTQGVAGDDNDINLHMMIDSVTNKIDIISRDECFPPLVDTYPVNDTQYLEYQPERLNEEGGYRYHVRIGNVNGQVKEILTKERDINGGTTLISVSTYNDVIYALENVKGKYNICSYDLNGSQLSCEEIGIVTEFANIPDELTGEEDPLWFIEVVNGYYFFSTQYGRKLVIQKTENGYIKNEYLSNIDITRVTCHTSTGNGILILYDYTKQVLIVFDTNDQSKTEYKLESVSPSPYLTTDGNKIVYSDINGALRVANIK